MAEIFSGAFARGAGRFDLAHETAGGRPGSPARRRAVAILSEFFADPRRPVRLERDLSGLASPDRDLARELILGVLRRRSALDAEIARFSRFPLDRLRRPLREILETAVFQVRYLDRIPARAAVHEAVDMARALSGEGASRVANGVLRALLREPPRPAPGTDAASLAAEFSHPEFLVARWIARFGIERTRAILAADDERGSLHLLMDPRRRGRDALALALAGEGVVACSIPIAANGLRVVSGNPLHTPSFDAGDYYVADAGSQVLPGLLPPGPVLLDLAAAPGGKSISAIFSGRFPSVISADRSLARLDFLRRNRARLSLGGLLPLAADVSAPPFAEGAFSRVLLDAPCSGTGTLRKNPEIRYRLSEEWIEALAVNERALLSSAAGAVAPGGFLLYSTCSLEAEENEQVAAGFLEGRRDFQPWPIDAPAELSPFVAGNVFRIFPDQGSDGFTAHLFRREGAI
jgi:16S rRNA (cytosine967-C5)-methyltransferase